MKKLFFALFIIFSMNISADNSDNKVYEFKLSNGINIVLCENFNFPVVMIGVLYDVGALEAPKGAFAINHLAEKLFLSQGIKNNLTENGISYSVDVYAGYTELIALMPPKSVKAFFQNVAKIKPKVSDFNYFKEQVRLCDKLNKIAGSDTIHDIGMGLLGKDTSKLIFNEKALNELKREDIVKFFEKYYTCNIRIIVCGAISHRGLLRALKNSILMMKTRRQCTSKYLDKRTSRTVFLEGKHQTNSLKMYYLLPSSFPKSQAYWSIFAKLMEDFFCGEYDYASDFEISPYLCYGNVMQKISLWPKGDVSLNQLQKVYDAFVIKLLNEPLSDDLQANLAFNEKNRVSVIKTHLSGLYELIEKSLLNNENVKNIFGYIDDIMEMKPNDFINISADIIRKNHILKIIEKYKADQ